MKHRRTFSNEFKRQVIEEYLSGVSTAAQLMRRHEISSGLLYHWKGPYNRGRLDNPPTHEAALEERVRQLEQPVGRLILENEFLKKAVQRSLAPPKRSGGSSLSIVTSYHKSKSRPDGEQALIARIEAVIEKFPGYGYRRVTGVLHRRGFRDNRKEVLRVMREQGLTRKPGRRRVRTTNSEHAHRVRGDVQPKEILFRCPNRICLTGGGSSTCFLHSFREKVLSTLHLWY